MSTTALFFVSVAAIALVVHPFLNRESLIVRHLIVAYSYLVVLRYTVWRVTSTLPEFRWQALELYAYLLCAIEVIATYLILKDVLAYRKTISRSKSADENLDWYGDDAPRVDVLIPTYNESWDILEKTLIGALNQNYPNYHVWLLDDGRRDWLKEKAAEWRVGYLTRSGNEHYKAGNINNALKELSQRFELEFISILDADFIAHPELLRRTAALMKDESVGIAQTPQWFYNPDPFQKLFGGVRSWPDEQRFWFDTVLPSWDAKGSAMCCGTSCLIRYRALEEIGGMPTSSITEDTMCSVVLRGKGWQTHFLSERLSVGLAPEGISEFLTQRVRWLIGTIQIYQFFGPAPGIKGRMDYWFNLWKFVILGLPRLGWMGAYVIFWFTGLWVLEAPLAEAMIYFGPLWVDRLLHGWLGSGRRTHVISDAHWTLLAPMWIEVTFRTLLFGSKTRFQVTDKGVKRNRVTIHWRPVRWLLMLAGALGFGLLYNLVEPGAPSFGDPYLPLNALATLYLMMTLLVATAPAFEGPNRRSLDRYETGEPVQVTGDGRRQTFRCRDLSVNGISLEVGEGEMLPARAELELAGTGTIQSTLVRRDGRVAAFEFVGDAHHTSLVQKIYCTGEYVPLPTRWSLTVGLNGVLHWLLSRPKFMLAYLR